MGLEVTRWLDHPKRSGWHLHFTPTSASWLNLVRWFNDPKPFVWHKTAEEIIARATRGRVALTQVKIATDQ